MKKIKWQSCYLGEEQATIIPIKILTPIEMASRVNLFCKTLDHKWRMAVQKAKKELHLNNNHSRKTFRRKTQ